MNTVSEKPTLPQTARTPANMPVWLDHAEADYCGALIRLTTSVEHGIQKLLFACVEFYPAELALPPAHGEQKHFDTVSLRFSITPVSVADAFAWYHRLGSGELTIPNVPRVPAIAVSLAPEPGSNRMLVGEHCPFEPSWHGGSRLHRLVPLDDDKPLDEPADSDARWERMRAWLRERLHYDVLVSDEWLGGAAMLAPNPVARSLGLHRIARGPAGEERFAFDVELRDGVSPTGLSLHVTEKRGGGIACIADLALDSLGSAELDFPQPVDRIGVELYCAKRGVLSILEPHAVLRSVEAGGSVKAGEVSVEVPSPRQGGASSTYTRDTVERLPTTRIGHEDGSATVQRLFELRARTVRRIGDRRPGGERRDSDAFLFHDNRDAAAAQIRSLIGNARSRLVLVDPYIDAIGLRDFALAAPMMGTKVTILTEYRNERPALDGSATSMQLLAWEIAAIEQEIVARGIAKLTVKVTGGAARRYHDRFLIVDDRLWHCGHSFNQVGRNEVSAMTRIAHPAQLLTFIETDLGRAGTFGDAHLRWQAALPKPMSKLRSALAKTARRVAGRLESRR